MDALEVDMLVHVINMKGARMDMDAKEARFKASKGF